MNTGASSAVGAGSREQRISDLAPVAVYTYSRVDHFRRTIEALRANLLAPHTVLYVVSDAPKVPAHAASVQAIRDIVDGLDGFREIVRIYRPQNFGTPASIFQAEEQIISDHGKIISMEDDNVTSSNYLNFINQGLRDFEADDGVFSICGYTPNVAAGRVPAGDFWLYPWNFAWGYGLWKHKYSRIYPLKNDYPRWQREGLLRRMKQAGGLYVADSVKRDFKGQGNFPDSVLGATMFERGMQCVVPTVSKVFNIGADGSGASGSRKTDRFDVELDASGREAFDFRSPSPDSQRLRRGAMQLFNGSLPTRVARRMGIYGELFLLRKRMQGFWRA